MKIYVFTDVSLRNVMQVYLLGCKPTHFDESLLLADVILRSQKCDPTVL